MFIKVKAVWLNLIILFIINTKCKRIYDEFTIAARKGNLTEINNLLEEIEDPSYRRNEALRQAAFYGHYEIVKRLLEYPTVNAGDVDNYAIIYSSCYNHSEIVRLLLKDANVNPSARHNKALRLASYEGHVEIVKMLLEDPRVNATDPNNESLLWASYFCRYDVVERLLEEKVDPKVYNYDAIFQARKYSNSGIDCKRVTELLLNDHRVTKSFKEIQSHRKK
jgi:ankyrin repeat protein